MKKIASRLLVLGMLGMLVLTGCRGNNNDNGGSAPGAPQNPSATAGDGSVTVQWSATDGATSYNIYWSTTAGVTKATGTKIEGATSPYAHTGLTNGTTYCYVVTAVNGAGESAESAEVSATPQAPIPGVPQNPSATAGALSVTVKWDAVTGATSYNIYWSNTAGVTKANGTKIPNTTSPYQHNSLTPVTTYYYVVTAVNATGESAESAQVSATMLSNAKAITAFSFANPAATGTIDESAKTIAVTVPYGTNVTALVATFITTGASVKVDGMEQESGTTPNSFTSQVVYTVTAADSTSVTYTVTVTVKAGAIALPKTGQVISHDTNTVQRDDGALQLGVAWPNPRFTNSDGTTPISGSVIVDKLTGLIWTRDGNAPGPDACGPATTKTWQGALDYVACLNANSYLGYADWRLPNRKELKSLVSHEQYNNATWLNNQGFSNVQPEYYWSSSTYAADTIIAWVVVMDAGYVDSSLKSSSRYAWPVRSGEGWHAPADLPKTGQATSYDVNAAKADDGALQKGVAWPTPRFTIGAGAEADCVTDNLTGLMWVKAPDSTTRLWQAALDHAAGMTLCGHTDWRLPNVTELESLVDVGQSNPVTWLNTTGPGNPNFSNVQANLYWSSSTYPGDTRFKWFMYMNSGGLDYAIQDNVFYIWPVRGGQ